MPDGNNLGLSGGFPTTVAAYSGTPGPGPAPTPWKQKGATIFYDEGGVTLPQSVTGGSKGKGTLNADDLYIDGELITSVPSGPAGGDLTGNYPNPLIKDNVDLGGNPTIELDPAPTDNTKKIPTTEWTNTAIAAAIAALPPVTVQEFGVAYGGTGGAITSDVTNFSWHDDTKILAVGGTITSTGRQQAMSATAVPAGGTLGAGFFFSSVANYGVMFGSGTPNKASAPGTLYLQSDGPPSYNKDGTVGGWARLGGSVSVGVTPPTGPSDGQLWFYSEDIVNGGILYVYYNDGNTQQWVPSSPQASPNTIIPPGSIMDFAGAAAPAGWLLCQGQLISRAVYAALFAAIGTLYGAGDGSTTFAVPDLGGRTTAGKEAVATRLTVAGSGVDGATIGSAGGNQNLSAHTHGGGSLTTADHLHGVGSLGTGGHAHTAAGLVGNNLVNGQSRAVGTADGTNSGYFQDIQVNAVGNLGISGATGAADRTLSVSGATSSTGAGASANVPPIMVMNKIIKI